MNISKENEISFFWRNIQNENLWNAVSGDRFILENGVYNSAITDTALEPRTVAGKTAAGHLVLMVADGDKITIGTPLVKGAKVQATVVNQGRADKVHVFKMRRRKYSKKQQGHRQNYTEIQVDQIAV